MIEIIPVIGIALVILTFIASLANWNWLFNLRTKCQNCGGVYKCRDGVMAENGFGTSASTAEPWLEFYCCDTCCNQARGGTVVIIYRGQLANK